jgi:hypothetical protein
MNPEGQKSEGRNSVTYRGGKVKDFIVSVSDNTS